MFKLSLMLSAFFLISDLSLAKNSTCECGTTLYKGASDTIIGGEPVKDVSEFPFLVGVYPPYSYCGGAIISPTFILTAAHCVFDNMKLMSCSGKKVSAKCYVTPKQIKIGVFSEKSKKKPNTFVQVEKIIPHPGYSTQEYPNDIALIKLTSPLECTKYTRPICLSEQKMVGIGQIIKIAGYGLPNPFENKLSSVMRTGVLFTIENNCRGVPDETILCVNGDKQTSCEGDSGSIAFVPKKNRYFAVGITSRFVGKECKIGNNAILPKISYYYPFIKKHVKDLPN